MRSLPSGLLTLALLLAGLGTAGPATADPSSPAQRAQSERRLASVALEGHGYGHGHGLSQYGAKGAAARGWSYRRIISFYYPHTRWAKAGGRVRVLISADTSSDVVVKPRRGLKVRQVGKRWTDLTAARPRAKKWRIRPLSRGRSEVSYRTGSWHRLTRLPGAAEFSAGGAPIRLVLPHGQASYRGTLRSAMPRPGSFARDTVNVLPLDAYLQGVVPSEVPALWHPQAVRAQAVAARSYAAFERAHPIARHYQICDTAHCQVYGGASVEHPAATDAVRRTRGQVRFAGGRPAFTQFSSSDGGWTADGGQRYLPAQRDPNEKRSGNPYADWRVDVPAAQVERAWPALGTLTGVVLGGRDGHGEWGGRVGTVTLRGSDHDVRVSGETFRSVLGLRSTWFQLR